MLEGIIYAEKNKDPSLYTENWWKSEYRKLLLGKRVRISKKQVYDKLVLGRSYKEKDERS